MLSMALIQVQGHGKSLFILLPKYNNSLAVGFGIFFNSSSSSAPEVLPSSNTKFHKGDPITAY